MRLQWFWRAVIACSIIASYEIGARYHSSKLVAPAVNTNAAPKQQSKAGAKENHEYLGQVKVVGPLANWMREAEENAAGGGGQSETPLLAYNTSESDRVIRRPASAPDNFLHTTFPVKTYTAFEILIPRGLVSASLSGSFESFTYGAHQRQPADVEVLLLDDGQFTDFVHRNAGSAVHSIEPCSRRSLTWLLNSDYHKAKKYYFVFYNPDAKRQLPSVKADFTIRFN